MSRDRELKRRPKSLQFTATLEKSYNRLWGCQVRVPKSIAETLTRRGSRRVVRRLNDSIEHQCALLPIGNGSFVLSVNKAWLDALHLEIGGKVRVRLRSDESRYGLPMPMELEELFRQDRDAHRLFHALTPGRLRTLLYIIGSANDPDLRAWRTSIIVRHLEENGGRVNYRQLNASLKRR